MLPLSKFLYLFAFASTVHSKVITYGCNQGSQPQLLQDSFEDVEAVAKVVSTALSSGKVNGKEDVFRSAYDPLFRPEDKQYLATLFTKLSNVRTIDLHITVYCNENHVSVHKGNWVDNSYTSIPNGRTFRLPIARASARKPGMKGSYTTIGYKYDDEWDCSDRSHVFIAAKRLNPPSNTDRDLRRYPEIVKDGLDGKHHRIEEIKPLAQTVMHEFIHAVGGVQGGDGKGKGKMIIGDGPRKDTYGWAKCNARRNSGEPNIHIADCITFLAQAIYLQIQGKDTYWETGAVDPTTLQATCD